MLHAVNIVEYFQELLQDEDKRVERLKKRNNERY